MKTLIDFLDLIKPVWQLTQLLVMCGLISYAVFSLMRKIDALLAIFDALLACCRVQRVSLGFFRDNEG
jgi:hypothetical protein